MVTIRYWAGLKEAAGTAVDEVDGRTLAEVLEIARSRHSDRFRTVLAVCSVVVDGDPVGARDRTTVLVQDGSLVDCLPPFAGG